MARKTSSRYEAPAVGAATGRMMRALVKRAAEGDSEALEQLLGLESVLQSAIHDAGEALHEFGHSWTYIGDVAGTTRQGACKRFGRSAS